MLKKLTLFMIIGLLLIALFPVSSPAAVDEINWNSYEEGLDKARRQDKPIFIDFWAEWCGPCQTMEEEVYPDEDVIQKSSEFINIKVNVDENGQIASQYNVQSIPTLVFLNSEGEMITSKVGYMSADELVNMMDQILNYEPPSDGDNQDTTDQTDNDQSIANDASSEDEPFWKSLIFVEIVISIFIAVGIILFLNKTRKESENS